MEWVELFFKYADRLTGYVLAVGGLIAACVYVIYPALKDSKYIPRILSYLILIASRDGVKLELSKEDKAIIRRYLDES